MHLKTGCYLWVNIRLPAVKKKSGEILFLFFNVSEKSGNSVKSQGKSLDAGKSVKPWIDTSPHNSFLGRESVSLAHFVDVGMISFSRLLYSTYSMFVIALHFNDPDNLNANITGFMFVGVGSIC